MTTGDLVSIVDPIQQENMLYGLSAQSFLSLNLTLPKH